MGTVGVFRASIAIILILVSRASSQESTVVECSASLQKTASNERLAEFDLGKLPVGKKFLLRFTIENPDGGEVQFSSAIMQCACSQLKTDQFVIPAQGRCTGSIAITTPQRRISPDVSEIILLVDDTGRSVARLIFRYELQGMLAFTERMVVARFQKDEKIKKIQIPFIVTNPLSAEELTLSSSDSLRDVVLQIASAEVGSVVVVTVSDAAVESVGVSGEIYVEHKNSGLKDHCYLTIQHMREIEISPSVIRFRQHNDDYVAHAIVHLPQMKHENPQGPAKANEKPQEPDEGHVRFRCHVNETRVPLTIKRLSPRIYRIKLSIDADEVVAISANKSPQKDSAPVLSWQVTNGPVKLKLETEFLVETR